MTSLGRPLPHDSAREHVRGEAVYLDDLPPLRGELLVDVVGSPVAHGRIVAVDVQAARELPGVVGVFVGADVPENSFGPIFHDEELLAKEFVQYVGQPVVAIAADSREAIAAAKALVQIHVEPLPPVLTIEDAVARQQFIGPTRRIARGDVATALVTADHRLAGELQIGGQEHFYLEAQVALAIPGEAGEITVHSSTQNPTEIQSVVARCLGLSLSQVVCVCKRMGGGFGGKETQAAQPAILAAFVAARLRRPARVVWGHEQDFQTTGKRHPYRNRYEVGFTDEGVITALKAEFHSNGGFSADLSLAVMERTLLHAENAYYIPHVEFTGTVCRTNLPSNTAFRGFGGPQAVAAMENVIHEVAAFLGVDPLVIRERNLYGMDARNVTPYGQMVHHNTLPRLLHELKQSSDYAARRLEIEAFNKSSRTQIKGLALTPVKFGISFTRRTLNQGSALVNLFLDGTVQVSTGGTEMGQGLNTKLRQLVADQFGIAVAAVRVMPTSTEKNHNTSPTAASAGTDLNGSAAVRACEAIRSRLAAVAARLMATAGLEPSPSHVDFAGGFLSDRRTTACPPSPPGSAGGEGMGVRGDSLSKDHASAKANPPSPPSPLPPQSRGERGDGRAVPFATVVQAAYEQRVDLGARGFYATPGVDFNRETGQGTPFHYFTNGAAAAEVEVDRFTGELRVVRVDLLMDLGRSINPAIDRGQIVGGFVQGMGWVTTESLQYTPAGALLSDSATTYKIPNASDVPADFRVALLGDVDNHENVYGSKAVGEPPLLLAVAVWAAVKQALASATPGRRPHLDLPATHEEILMRLTGPSISVGPPAPAANGTAGATYPQPTLVR